MDSIVRVVPGRIQMIIARLQSSAKTAPKRFLPKPPRKDSLLKFLRVIRFRRCRLIPMSGLKNWGELRIRWSGAVKDRITMSLFHGRMRSRLLDKSYRPLILPIGHRFTHLDAPVTKQRL